MEHERKRFGRRAGALVLSGLLAASGVAIATTTASAPAEAAESASQLWGAPGAVSGANGVGQTRNWTFGDPASPAVTMTETLTEANGASFIVAGSAPNGARDSFTYLTPTPAQGTAFGMHETRAGGSTATFSLDKPVQGLTFHPLNLDTALLTMSGTNAAGTPLSLERLNGNSVFQIDTAQNTINTNPGVTAGTWCLNDASGANGNGRCGSVRIGPGAVKDVTMHVAYGANDGWGYFFSYPTASLTKSFDAAAVRVGQGTTLTFVVENPAGEGQIDLSALDFTDNLSAGLVVGAGGASASASCGAAPALTATEGANTIAASNLNVAAGASCEITVPVVATDAGTGTIANTNANITTGIGNLVPKIDPGTALTVYPPAPDMDGCAAGVSLVNGGFEEPALPGSGGYQQVPQANVPGWDTTDSQGSIEIWQDGFGGGGPAVPAAEGKQFAELNAFSAGTLYQDVATTPGQTITWSLQHRGRAGDDTMRVVIGDPAVPLDQLPQNGSELTDGNSAWGAHTGSYIVPVGQTTTRFGFQAVSSAGGVASGNFLDDITFGTGPCLESVKSVEKLTNTSDPEVTVGDRLRYTIATTNNGSSPAAAVVSRDAVPAGTEFVPGSIRIAGNSVTDASGDDTGELADGEVVARLGAGANATTGGSVAKDATASYSFDVIVTEAAAGTTVSNTAEVDFTDPISDEERTTETNETSTTVTGRPELTLTKSSTPSGAAAYRAGQEIVYSFVIENTGNVTVTDITVDEQEFTGTGTLSDIVCPAGAGSLAPNDTVTCEASYTLTQADVDAGELSNTATATGTFGGSAVESDESTTSIPATAEPGLELIKSSDTGTVTRAGQVVTYSFTLTNTGNVSLADPSVTEQEFSGKGKLGAVECPAQPNPLLPGQKIVCTAEYTVVVGDLTGKPLSNTATASATVPGGDRIDADGSTAEIKSSKAPGQSLENTGGASMAWALASAALLLAAGTGVLVMRRRKNA